MPAMIFLRRTWAFASDDFVLSGAFDILMRMICVIIMGIPFVVESNFRNCLPGSLQTVFFSLLFALEFVMMMVDLTLSLLSARGGIMEVSKRSHVPSVLLVFYLVSFVQLPLHCVNIYFAVSTYKPTCSRNVIGAFVAGNAIRLLHIIQCFVWLAAHFRRSGAFWRRLIYEGHSLHTRFGPPNADSDVKREAQEVLSRSVRRKLKRLVSFGRSRCRTVDHQETDEQVAISSAAALFSEMFYDVDLVASDVVAGLILLRWQTNQWIGCGHRVPMELIERDTVPFNTPSENPTYSKTPLESGDVVAHQLPVESVEMHWLSIQRIQRVGQLAVSLYGQLFYHLLHRFAPTSLCRLCNRLNSLSRSAASYAFPFDCCLCSNKNCDLAAMLEISELHPDEIIAVDFENTVYQSPFLVALDDRTRCIVVAVRGTLSFEDAVVDLLYDAARLDEVESLAQAGSESRPTFVGHRGMVNSARRLYQRLIESGYIEVAKNKRPHYPLVVCGHSLGAGIACFLAILFRPLYPEVKGYALSCPLGTMNSELCTYTKPFLVSVIYGYDAFARMNKATVMDFKWRLLDALSASNVPKHRIIGRGVGLCLLRCCYKGCSASCCPAKVPPIVGEDTHLLSPLAKKRLFHPNPDIPTRFRGDIHFSPIEEGDTGGITERAQWPSRLLPGTRSLLRWINSPNSPLFCASTSNFPRVESPQSMSAHHQLDMERSLDLLDGTFGGLVLHVVDVCPNKNLHDAHLSSGEFLHRSDDTHRMESNMFLSPNLLHEPDACCSSHRTPTATVAVWTSGDQFRTLLVHPRMFSDHAPHNFLRALNRLYSESVGDPNFANLCVKPNEVFRRLR